MFLVAAARLPRLVSFAAINCSNATGSFWNAEDNRVDYLDVDADDLCVSFHDDYSDFVDELKAIVDIAQVYV